MTKQAKKLKRWFNKYLLATTPAKLLLAGLMAYVQTFLGAILSIFVANDAGPMVFVAALTYWSFFVMNIQRAANGTLWGNVAFVIGASLGTWTGTVFVFKHMAQWFI
jgi:hypothetical protein